MEAVFAPAAGALAALASKCPFPLAEPLTLLLAALLVLLLFRWRRGACLLLAVLLAGYGLLWAPAYSLPAAHAVGKDADAAALTVVCDELIERLNARKDFALPNDLGARALEAARLVETPAPISAAPKFARYPEWMRAFSLAGLYVPWTAEALCDPTAPAAGQPFTAVHELMHMGGVADEGQANICAYIACQRYGGIFAASADLWRSNTPWTPCARWTRMPGRRAWPRSTARRETVFSPLAAPLPRRLRRNLSCAWAAPGSPAITARWPRGWRRVLYERIEKRAH